MTGEGEPPDERLVRSLAVLLLVGAAIRLVAAIVAGFIDWHTAPGTLFPSGRARAYDVLTTFGGGGDGAGVVLAIIATLVVWRVSRAGDPLAATLRTSLCWVLGVTAALASLNAIGTGIFFSAFPIDQDSRVVANAGFALAAVVLTGGGIVLTRQLAAAVDDRPLVGDDIDAFVFAVDRHNGDVRAFFTAQDAVRQMHAYSIEDDEFVFYTDEGVVLRASVEADRVALHLTNEERLTELLAYLKEFANRRGIRIDDDEADDPTAYVDRVNRWQWLEKWPPWMRPLGYVFRRR